jgi:hypothetical protein
MVQHGVWNDQTLILTNEEWRLESDLPAGTLERKDEGGATDQPSEPQAVESEPQDAESETQTAESEPQAVEGEPQPEPTTETSDSIGARVRARQRGRGESSVAAIATAHELDSIDRAVAALGYRASNITTSPHQLAAINATAVAASAVSGSPPEKEARKIYATSVVMAALQGERLPPYEPAATDTTTGATASLAAIIEQSTSGSLLAADEHVGDDDPVSEIIMLAKANKGVVTYRQQLKSPQASEWKQARLDELHKLAEMGAVGATVRT